VERDLIDLDAERRRRLNRPVLDLLRQVRHQGMLSRAERADLAERARQAVAFALAAFAPVQAS